MAIVAERLRRLTRNQLGSPRAGSSPADCDLSPRNFCLSKGEYWPNFFPLKPNHCNYVAEIKREFPYVPRTVRYIYIHLICTHMQLIVAIVAEWLRRLTRNQLGSPRAGSSPADCDNDDFARIGNLWLWGTGTIS